MAQRRVGLHELLDLLFARGQVYLVQTDDRLQPLAGGSDQVAVQQLEPDGGLPDRGDDEELIDVRDDHLSEMSVEHVGAPETGAAWLHPLDGSMSGA